MFIKDEKGINMGSAAAFYDYNYKPVLLKDLKARILDIGCGMGQFIYHLYKKKYTNVKDEREKEGRMGMKRQRNTHGKIAEKLMYGIKKKYYLK